MGDIVWYETKRIFKGKRRNVWKQEGEGQHPPHLPNQTVWETATWRGWHWQDCSKIPVKFQSSKIQARERLFFLNLRMLSFLSPFSTEYSPFSSERHPGLLHGWQTQAIICHFPGWALAGSWISRGSTQIQALHYGILFLLQNYEEYCLLGGCWHSPWFLLGASHQLSHLHLLEMFALWYRNNTLHMITVKTIVMWLLSFSGYSNNYAGLCLANEIIYTQNLYV